MHARCTVDYNKAHGLSYEFVYVCRLLRQSRFPTSLKFSIRMPLLGRWHSIWILRIHHQAMSVRHGLKSHSVSHSDAARRPICLVCAHVSICASICVSVCVSMCLLVCLSVSFWTFASSDISLAPPRGEEVHWCTSSMQCSEDRPCNWEELNDRRQEDLLLPSHLPSVI